ASVSRIRFHFRFLKKLKLRSRKIRGLQSRASTKNWLARWRRTFAVFIRRNRIRAKVCGIWASKFVAKWAKPFSNMATTRKAARQRVHQRIRKRVAGTAERPRLAVNFSGKHIYAQVIDDDVGRTLAAASTMEHPL